jgi:hypothetical protein
MYDRPERFASSGRGGVVVEANADEDAVQDVFR